MTIRSVSAKYRPIGFQATREGLETPVAALEDKLVQTAAVDPVVKGSLTQMSAFAGALDADNTLVVKGHLKNMLWSMRWWLQAMHPEACTDDVKHTVEAARSAAQDISFENPWPGEIITVRPPINGVANYRKITDRISAGGQPTQEGVKWLQGEGYATEIDLRGSDSDNEWIEPTWDPSVKRCPIPIEDMGSPTMEQVLAFKKIVEDPNSGKVFVHCKAGIGRTTAVIACWRITCGWSADRALAEADFNLPGASLAQQAAIRAFERQWRDDREKACG